MQVRIPSPKEIRQKIIDHPNMSYVGMLAVVFGVSYALSRSVAKSVYGDVLIPANDLTYQHLMAGDHMTLQMYGEEFHYAPIHHEPVAS